MAPGRPVHVLAALIHRTGQIAGQGLVDTQTNEIPQLKDLRGPLDGAGPVVTVDAWHTQTETARYLVEDKHAPYVMPVKGNPPFVHDACTALEPA